MHKLDLFPDVIARVHKRVGRAHPFDHLDASRTALVVIDMQNYFVAPESPACVPMASAVVPAINRLAADLRDRGGHVIWVRGTAENAAQSWSVFTRQLMPSAAGDRRAALLDGEGFPFWRDNDIRPQDAQVSKTRFSAFIEGSSNVVQHLVARDCDTLLIAGTVTGVCCDSSGRDAMMLNYRVVMVADALAAHSDQEHNASLSAFYATFGDVQTVDECIASLDRDAMTKPAIAGTRA